MALGLATSSDGIHWEKSAKNPIFVPKEISKSNQFWFHSVLYVNSTIFLFIEGDINQTTQIYLATHEGEIIP
jgi:sucrose-6-phosphate hydrolase SacC (GH32 family)